MAGSFMISAAAIPSRTGCCNFPRACAPAAGFISSPRKAPRKKLVHKIETQALATLPGDTSYYSAHDELIGNLKKILGHAKNDRHAVFGQERDSLCFDGRCRHARTSAQHRRESGHLRRSSAEIRSLLDKIPAGIPPRRGPDYRRHRSGSFPPAPANRSAKKSPITEYNLQQWILHKFEEAGIETEEGPDVAVNENASDPHYGPSREKSSPIKEGDLLLLDVWGKQKTPGSVYYDITWTGYLGAKVPDKYAKVFKVVREARDRGVSMILEHIKTGKPLQGWQVDNATPRRGRKSRLRKILFFIALGTIFGQTVHGNGVNIDGLETRDERHLIPGTCNSIEPGIYLPEFGIRSEVDVYIDEGEARVTGAVQTEILPLLA